MKKNKICTILFALLFCLQLFLMEKYSLTTDILHHQPQESKIPGYYNMIEILGSVLNARLSGKEKILIFSDEYFSNRGGGLPNLYLKYELYPNEVILNSKFYIAETDLSFEDIKQLTELHHPTILIIFGKNMKAYFETSEKEVSIYRFHSPENVELLDQFDLALYPLYLKMQTPKLQKEFEKTVNSIKKMTIDYRDFESIDLLHQFALDLLEAKEIELAKEWGKFYYENINTLDGKLDLQMGDIYFEEKNYEEAKKYYGSCLASEECDRDYVIKKYEEMGENT